MDDLAERVQDELLAQLKLLEKIGPTLGRPGVDTLKSSEHTNMKGLRFAADGGEWRVAFAFDPRRSEIVPLAGDKSGGSEKRFYKELIKTADKRFTAHCVRVKKEVKESK